MNYVQHPSNNHVFGAPKDWDHSKEPCGALPVTLTEHQGQRCIMSFWEPDADERAAILRGKPIILIVYGQSHPVVALGTEA